MLSKSLSDYQSLALNPKSVSICLGPPICKINFHKSLKVMKRSSLVLVLVTCRAVAQGDESSPPCNLNCTRPVRPALWCLKCTYNELLRDQPEFK